jgi:hypothetical protein
MNADLENLSHLVDSGDCYEPMQCVYNSVTIPITHDLDGDPCVGRHRLLRAVFGDHAGDRDALDARIAALTPELRQRGCKLYKWGDVRKVLFTAAETDANLRTAIDGFERALYVAVRKALAASAEGWTRRAEELEKKAAAKLEHASELRELKRTFDEAFKATPETAVFTDRPPKVARVDEDVAEEKSSSYSEPKTASYEEEEDSS